MLPSGAATAPKTPVDASMMAGSFSRIVCSRAASLNSFQASALRRMAVASATPWASMALACARPMASIFAASARPSASTAAARPAPSFRSSFLLGLGEGDDRATRRPSASRMADCFAAFRADDRGLPIGFGRLDDGGFELLLPAEHFLLLNGDQLLRARPLDLDFLGDDRLPRGRLGQRAGLLRRAPSAFRSPPDTAPGGS